MVFASFKVASEKARSVTLLPRVVIPTQNAATPICIQRSRGLVHPDGLPLR